MLQPNKRFSTVRNKDNELFVRLLTTVVPILSLGGIRSRSATSDGSLAFLLRLTNSGVGGVATLQNSYLNKQ